MVKEPRAPDALLLAQRQHVFPLLDSVEARRAVVVALREVVDFHETQQVHDLLLVRGRPIRQLDGVRHLVGQRAADRVGTLGHQKYLLGRQLAARVVARASMVPPERPKAPKDPKEALAARVGSRDDERGARERQTSAARDADRPAPRGRCPESGWSRLETA